MVGVLAAIWFVGLAVMLVVLWWQRATAAQRSVDRLIERGGLPTTPQFVAAALEWHRRRQELLLIGLGVGILVAAVAQFVVGDGWNVQVVTWSAALAVAGGGFAALMHAYRNVRAARQEGRRTASLRQRRLTDYLSPIEVAIHLVAVVFPLAGIALGIVAGGRAWVLVLSGAVAVLLWAGGLALQQMTLKVNHQAAGEDELRWQEALRGTALRDLGAVMLSVCWLLGASVPQWFDWPSDVPHVVEPLSQYLFSASLILVAILSFVGTNRQVLQRVRRVTG
ncbi:hypothetical protein [Kribbella sp. NPDC004875]|uniref:hypothetical protein n=1 Tax=Kribbella sp. NPDC004875 TaxID=3364107 RepID=UPI0036BDE234